MDREEPSPLPPAVLDDVDALLFFPAPGCVVGNEPGDFGVEGRAAQEELIGLVEVLLRQHARMALGVDDDRFELAARPGGHLDGALAGVARRLRADDLQPLLEPVGARRSARLRGRSFPELRAKKENSRKGQPGRKAAGPRQTATIASQREPEMSRHMAALAALLVVLSGSGLLAIRPKTEETSAPKKSPDAAAADAMNSGLKRLARADELEAKNPKQARKDYEGALKDFQTAVKLAPGNYRAHNNLGYSLPEAGELRARARELRTGAEAGAGVFRGD